MTEARNPNERGRPTTLPAVVADEAAFREWYELVLPRVYGLFLSRAGGNDALAEELTRQAFVEAVRRPDEYDGRTDIVTWLYSLGLASSPMPLPAMGLDRPMDRPPSGFATEPHPAFAETLLMRLRAEAGRSRGGGRRWIVAVAAAVLLVAALAGGVAVGSGLVRLPWSAEVPSPVATPSPVAQATATPSPSVQATSTPGASPSATAPAPTGIAAGDLVATTAEALTVREEPGTDAVGLGTLALDSVSYVVAGPVEADGYPWYLVTGLGLPPATGCGPDSDGTDPYECPIWFGWVAGANEQGSSWLAEHAADCPEPPAELMELTLGRTSLELLHCYGGRDLVFRAWLPVERSETPACDAVPDVQPETVWLRCAELVLGWDPGYWEAISVAIDPDAGVDLQQTTRPVDAPEPGSQPDGGWIEVTAHLDDPRASSCANAAAATDEDLRIILGCRATLVVTRAEPTSAP